MKEEQVEIIEKFQDGQIISRKINGVEVTIPEEENSFVQVKKLSFKKAKSIFGTYPLPPKEQIIKVSEYESKMLYKR